VLKRAYRNKAAALMGEKEAKGLGDEFFQASFLNFGSRAHEAGKVADFFL